MVGSEFVRELRRTHTKLPVLVISGLEEAEDLYKDLNVLFRLKPLLPEHLLSCVHRLVSSGMMDS
jgi:DNA-binding response OmpR family regulator